jgi:hypothetical protein
MQKFQHKLSCKIHKENELEHEVRSNVNKIKKKDSLKFDLSKFSK